MYKLSIDFKTAEELINFVTKLGAPINSVIDVVPAALPPVIEEAKPKKVKKEQPVELPPELPKAEIKLPSFDRDAAIAKATEVIQELSSLVESPVLAQTLADLYVEAGCPIGTKISKLEDSLLEKFMPLFLKKASELKNKKQASFI